MRQWTLLKFGCKEHSHTNKKKRRTEKSVQRFIFFPFKVLSRLSHELREYFDYNARER